MADEKAQTPHLPSAACLCRSLPCETTITASENGDKGSIDADVCDKALNNTAIVSNFVKEACRYAPTSLLRILSLLLASQTS